MTKSPTTKSKPTTTNKFVASSHDIAISPRPDTPAQNLPEAITKSATVIAMLSGKTGATLGDICTATDWQPHSARAFLSGLKKKGHNITKSRRNDVTCYHIEVCDSGGRS